MLPQVPELTASGFLFGVDAEPGVTADVAVAPIGPRLRGEVRCYAPGGLLIGGKIDLRPTYGDLYLGLTTPDGSVVDYGNLSFGFALMDGDDLLADGQWPEPNVRYVSSDQQYLLAARLNYLPDTAYRLTLWVEDGERYEATYTLVTPRPDRPYPSWAWDGSVWQPPIPYPSEGDWVWDEAGQQWVPAE